MPNFLIGILVVGGFFLAYYLTQSFVWSCAISVVIVIGIATFLGLRQAKKLKDLGVKAEGLKGLYPEVRQLTEQGWKLGEPLSSVFDAPQKEVKPIESLDIAKYEVTRDVQGLIKAFDAPQGSPIVYQQAMESLVRIGLPAVEPLCSALVSGKIKAERFPFLALGLIGDRRAVDAILRRLPNTQYPDAAVLALEKLGWQPSQAEFQGLITAFRSGDTHVKSAILRYLPQIKNEHTDDLLAEALDTADEHIQKVAIEISVKLDSPKTIDILSKGLRSRYAEIRKYSVESLMTAGNTSLIAEVAGLLDDRSEKVRQAAQEYLERFDPKEVEAVQKEKSKNAPTESSIHTDASPNAETTEDENHGVTFDRKMKRGPASYELYTADDAEHAKTFLLGKNVTKEFFFIEVKTPDQGTWGVDKDGLYLVELCPWQKDLKLAECEGQISKWPTMHAMLAVNQGVMDNAVAMARCGKCGHEWWDGIQPNQATIVCCPQCKTYNQVGAKVHVIKAGEPAKPVTKQSETRPASQTHPFQPGQKEPEAYAQYIGSLVKQKMDQTLDQIVVLIGFENQDKVAEILDQVADIGLHTEDVQQGPQFGNRNPLIELRYQDGIDQNLVEADARALKGWGATDISAVGISQETMREFQYWYGEGRCPFLVARKD